jgi:hypothetical protein
VPKRVFLSYKRHSDPDESLVLEIRRALGEAGHEVFIDQEMPAGIKWAEQIDRHIRECDALIVFLTAASSRSEMVQSEVEKAREYKRVIIPVRVAFAGELPYPLSAYLAPIQYAEWRGPSDAGKLLQDLLKALNDVPLPPASPAPQPSTPAELPPAPGGAIDVNDPHYVARSFDQRALSEASATGRTVVLKGPRQVGKTSLLFRMIARARDSGKSVAYVDLQLFETDALRKPELFYKRFTSEIANGLDIEPPANPRTPQDVTRWLERQVLKPSPAPVSLAIDETERALWADFKEDLFGMMRSWHNGRASPTAPAWKKLDLFLVTSTEPALFIQGAQSPFNVGTIVTLTGFDDAALAAMNRVRGEPLNSGELIRLRELVAGQPYLVSKAMYEVSLPSLRMMPTELFASAADDHGPFRDHLQRFVIALQDMPEVLSAFREVLQGRGCRDEKMAYRLESAGLATRQAGKVVAGCPLYQQFFERRLSG